MLRQLLAFNVLNASLPLLIEYYDQKYREEDIQLAFPDDPSNFNLPVKETFDFIIVGGGTAGLVLARRLSEVYSVLVLEAGGNPIPLESAVYVSPLISNAPTINFLVSSIPQKYTGSNGGSGAILESSSGKMLGGSSSHNEGHYERGSPHDYDRWAEVTGDPSWRWENVLKYFLKAEDYHGQFPSNGQHRTGGLLPVTKCELGTRDGLWESIAKDLGYEYRDSKGPLKLGFSPAEFNKNLTTGRRVSSYTAFVQPIENTRKNLVIRRYSVASEVLFDGKRAVGVVYERHKVPSVVFASKEVIICAGALVTPILLIRSGIGPRGELKKAKVPPVQILPVGFNLQDHISLYTPPINVSASAIKTDYYKLQFKDFNTFIQTGKGPLAAYGKTEAFIQSRRAKKEKDYPDWPDIQVYLGNINLKNAIYCLPNLERPRSTGRIYYNGSGTTLEEQLQPIIDYNFFSDPTDLNPLIEGIQFCRKIVNSPTMKEIGARFESFAKSVPHCKKSGRVGSRKFWVCFVKAMSTSDNHQVGTARMGKPDDPRSVLDSKLRVLGVTGLRVCDGSIMPYITSANLAGPIMMIAEKTADEILKEWNSK